MWQNLIDIFTAPKVAFTRILEKPSVLFPLLLLVVVLASIQVGYFATSDRGFLIDQLLDQALTANPSLRAADLRRNYESMNPTVLGVSAGVGTAVVLSVIFSLTAVYLNFMSKFGHEGRSYKHWMSLVCWTSMPALLVGLAAWVVMLGGGGQVPIMALQPLSFDELFGIHSGKPILQNLSLPTLWSWALLVLGYQHFTNSTLTRAAVIALAPYVLLYGIWAWFSFN
jgi:hypothetical protein